MRYIKKDIVRALSRLTGERKEDSAIMVDAVLLTILTILENAPAGSRVELRDFGVFHINALPPMLYNPGPNKGVLKLDWRRKVIFKPGRGLRKSLKRWVPPDDNAAVKRTARSATLWKNKRGD